jgi:hypothetical protein
MKGYHEQSLGPKEFFREIKNYGFYVAFCNWLICFTKWFIKAKRIQVTYFKTK